MKATTPPHCPTHRGRHSYTPGCDGCQTYSRIRYQIRSRQRAYGTWRGMADAGPTRQHIQTLIDAGMTYRRIATVSGSTLDTIRDIHRGRHTRIKPATVDLVMTATVTPDYLVSSLGAARRLQAFTHAGYAMPDLLPLLPGTSLNTLYRWRIRTTRWIRRTSHDQLAELYRRLWDLDGPHPEATRYAARQGWQPLEAWTEATLDDPDAQPYAAPEAVLFVDWEKINRARLETGHRMRVPFTQLTPAEQTALFTQHMVRGGSHRGFRDRYRPVPIEDLRRLVTERGGVL